MKTLVPGTYRRVYVDPVLDICPPFVIHPETSELAEQLLIDPQALANENYSGIYDESGDYIPQYAENPDDIPQGSTIDPNPGTAPGGASDPVDGNKPADTTESSDVSQKD